VRPRPLHPLAFAAYPVLFLYARNISSVPVGDLMQALVGALFTAAALFGLGWLVFRSRLRAALSATVLLVFASVFGALIGWWNSLPVSASLGATDEVLAATWIALGVLVAVLVQHVRKGLPSVTKVLNAVGAGLLVLPLITIGHERFPVNPFNSTARAATNTTASSALVKGDGPQRDIYYIILDRYAGNDTLRRHYDFDNGPFLDGLSERGFFVANSWANYPRTTHSLASSLNMRYLDDLAAEVGVDHRSTDPLFEQLKRPAVVRSLKQIGYSYVLVPSWWKHTADDPSADLKLVARSRSPFAQSLLESSVAAPFVEHLGDADPRREHWELTRRQFTLLEQMPSRPGPKFVFAHILLPHEPMLFHADGTFKPGDEAKRLSFAENYLDQLKYANARVDRLVDRLLDVPPERQPIVILQSDEGPFPSRYASGGGGMFRWDRATPAQLEVKMNILNAYYFPGLEQTGLYERISPVNSFRVLFNDYFAAALPLLPDKVVAWEDGQHVYAFHDVTAASNEYRRIRDRVDRRRAAARSTADGGRDESAR
jgi:hypothetical protein